MRLGVQVMSACLVDVSVAGLVAIATRPRPYTPPLLTHTRYITQPISFFSILSPAQYWVRSTNHLVPRYAISSIPPSSGPSLYS